MLPFGGKIQKTKRALEGKSKIKTWEKMCRELSKKFLPSHHYEDSFIQLQNLRQKKLVCRIIH